MAEFGGEADRLVTSQLTEHLRKIERTTDADCLCYVGPIAFGADYQIRAAIEGLRDGARQRGAKLVFVLETDGGHAEVARRISDTLRHHYRVVDFLVPSHAMSAGTILALSGDAIWMDYYSVLGPIDPQIPNQDHTRLIPATGWLIRYQELLDKANDGTAGPGELLILSNFQQGDLYSYEQARELSVSLAEEWLVKYKFKNWTTTETRGEKVTRAMKTKRAREIAEKLNNPKIWNSHGIGIRMEVLRKNLNLRIDDFGENESLNESVRSYHRLLVDYMGKRGQGGVVHTRTNYLPIGG